MFLCRRRPDITHDEYAEKVLRGHVPLALRHHPTMRHYVVNIVARALTPGASEIDSIGELSFDTLEDYRERLYDSPEGEATIHEDVVGFMGGADSYECTAHVHRKPDGWVVGRTTPGVKLVSGIKRKPDMTHEQFVEHWLGSHVPLALKQGDGLAHYVTNVVDSRLSEAGEDFDGIAEIGFASQDDMRMQLFGDPDRSKVVAEDNDRFIGSMRAWLAVEHPQK